MSAKLLDGRWFRVLTVIDQFTRECLTLVADGVAAGCRMSVASGSCPSGKTTARQSANPRANQTGPLTLR